MPPMLRTLLISLLALGLAACTSKPVLTPQQMVPHSQPYSDAQLQRAILAALSQRGWTVDQIKPCTVSASITVRGRHHAEIDVVYNPSTYLIRYRDSRALDYKDGKIHRNYNRWVNNLSQSILKELQLAQTRQD
ncbi:hypothetical protein [Pseudomonas zhanjiangensis]|uniref:Lipoprotein n=1 Tax=Pseudomonas zhanjiangensis TaxID=3239015 RepID=A0ABV3YRI0_9PSED